MLVGISQDVRDILSLLGLNLVNLVQIRILPEHQGVLSAVVPQVGLNMTRIFSRADVYLGNISTKE